MPAHSAASLPPAAPPHLTCCHSTVTAFVQNATEAKARHLAQRELLKGLEQQLKGAQAAGLSVAEVQQLQEEGR